jgi:heat shock protein HslJ
MDGRVGITLGILISGIAFAGCGRPEKGGDPKEASSPRPAEDAGPHTGSGGSPLAGTSWRLVEFQSMDDAIGTLRPEDPSLYTMRLNEDGTVQFRLNCNRANGSWSAAPGSDPASGSFELGPLAATSALCPPPSLDEQISRHSEYVRSYLLKDGRLYLSLMADGGIYAWEPLEDGRFETEPDSALEDAIREASPSYTREMVGIGGQQARYVYSRVDLNDDGADEVLVYLLGSIFCGTGGCNLMVFTPAEGRYALVSDFPITREPVIVSPERNEGWNDLVRLESGGGAEASYVRHRFDGKRYVEGERTSADGAPEGKRVLTGGFTFEDGILLEPRSQPQPEERENL